jgi:hypothetical protein
MTCFTYRLVQTLAPNYKQHILLSAELKEICYSLRELYVKSVYFNLIGRRGCEFHETPKGGRGH